MPINKNRGLDIYGDGAAPVSDDRPDCPWMDDKKCHLNKCGLFVQTSKDEGVCPFHAWGVNEVNKLRKGIQNESESKAEGNA